jgi:hypothetical protein
VWARERKSTEKADRVMEDGREASGEVAMEDGRERHQGKWSWLVV